MRQLGLTLLPLLGRLTLPTNYLRRFWPTLRIFIAGQGVVQIINLVSGFLILHWLSIEDYGKYGLAYSFQATVNILIDLGFSSTVIALVGHRTADPKIIGSYVRSGRSIRQKLFLFIIPASSLVFFYQTGVQKWPVSLTISALITIIISIYASGISGYYSAAFFIKRDLSKYYKIQLLGSLVKIVSLPALYAVHQISTASALWMNAIGTFVTAMAMRSASGRMIEEPPRADPAITRQMVSYFLPNIPGIIFFAFQGQVAVFLVAIFANGSAIARVSALARLGQLFTFLSALNPAILEPWFAKANGKQIYRRIGAAFGSAMLICIFLIALSNAAPDAFLIILGAKYFNLKRELVYSIAASCAWYSIGLVWAAVTARRFIYWETTGLNMVFIVCAQVAFLTHWGVSTPLRAVQLNLAMALASLLAHLLNLCYGIWRGPRLSVRVAEAA